MSRILIPDPSVLAALQQAFPGYNAQRALTKYLRALESQLWRAEVKGRTLYQLRLGLYPVSLHDLAQQGGQFGPQKVRLHKWLRENQLELVKTVTTGSNLTEKMSNVKLTSLVAYVDPAPILPTNSLASPAVNQAPMPSFDLSDFDEGDDLIKRLYSDLMGEDREENIKNYHRVPVNIASLRNYRRWLESSATRLNQAQKEQYLQQSQVILTVAEILGCYLQRKKPSPFGRMYYEGLSVQNINKELRQAMLGGCWEYDIRSSVVAWKMGYADEAHAHYQLNRKLEKEFFSSIYYLEDKEMLLAEVRRDVFGKDHALSKDYQNRLIKQALTALSFGATARSAGWQDAAGEWHNPALVDIFRNKEERDRFMKQDIISRFIKEQKLLDDYLFAAAKEIAPTLLQKRIVQTPSGRPSKAKVLAFCYQHAETRVMNIVRRVAKEHGRQVVANIHDAIVVKPRFGTDLKEDIEYQMQIETKNPYWRLTTKELRPYLPPNPDDEPEARAHRRRIAEEEAKAQGVAWVPEHPSLSERQRQWALAAPKPLVEGFDDGSRAYRNR